MTKLGQLCERRRVGRADQELYSSSVTKSPHTLHPSTVPPFTLQNEREVEEKEIPQTQAQTQKDESPFQVIAQLCVG
ncbi:hypothetical protein LshimejAT787_0703820 [Lyophyllum shimeji]|uniref:Uncharacterized protein n=1 Tax=Lyophyllum shimeji TaxID=47721 RepID=A0A9P3PR53_LYOSH|nr:hypothetical protein LshimejAT787_0703820 [Lyophyllum shimeji]